MLLDGVQDVGELDLGGQGVSMVNDWHPIWAIPAVHWGATQPQSSKQASHLPPLAPAPTHIRCSDSPSAGSAHRLLRTTRWRTGPQSGTWTGKERQGGQTSPLPPKVELGGVEEAAHVLCEEEIQ